MVYIAVIISSYNVLMLSVCSLGQGYLLEDGYFSYAIYESGHCCYEWK